MIIPYMGFSNFRITLIYTHRRKLLDLNKYSPIGLLSGVILAWSFCQKVVKQMEEEPIEATL